MSTVLLFLSVAVAAPHADANPVFHQLVRQGVSPDGEKFFPLPAPLMPDGLNADAQRKIVESVVPAGRKYADFIRNSPVAPHILQMKTIAGGNPQAPMQSVDIYFVAYGDMNRLTDKNFLADAFQQNQQQGAQGVALTPQDLAERGIEIAPENHEHEGYGQSTMDLLNRVELSVVGRSFWSKTDESIVTAALVDPRFLDDEKFANVWRPLRRNEAGALQKGSPQPYRGAGLYMKITRLAEPQGALFVEAHVVYAEPHGWFDGKNLLGAKIRVAVQEAVRDTRQEMLRAAQQAKQRKPGA